MSFWLDVTHEKTIDTDLVPWRRSAACVMNNGDIALWGKTSKKASLQFHFYNKDGKKKDDEKKHGEKEKKIKALCPHKELVRMLSIVIKNDEYLAVSCKECRDINLQHLTIDTAYQAFGSCACGAMCYGKEGGIFAIDCIEHSPVIEIGCRNPFLPKQFVYGETVQTLMKSFSDLCYISSRDILVIPAHKKIRVRDPFSDDEEDEDSDEDEKKEGPAMIRAVQSRGGKVLWEVKKVGGVETCVRGVVYSHKYDVLLVADGSNQRILVLQPESGEHLKTIGLSSDVVSALQLFLHRDQLILEYGDHSKIKLSFYSIRGRERPHGYLEAACDGASVTLSSPDSDVTLHVPRNTILGDVAAWVHTNPTIFKHLLPNRECLISPIVMFGPKSITDPVTCRAGQYFTIQIPHAVPKIDGLESKIRVRYGDIHGPSLLMKQAYQRGQLSDQEVSYQVNDSHITVYSRLLTGFVVTLSRDDCYSEESSIRVFGALGDSCLCLKAYLCSPLYAIKDFQEHLKRQAGTGMKCLQVQHIKFEPESTVNPIEISLAPEEQENWESVEPKTMNKFRIRCRHICDHDLKVLASYKVFPTVSEVDEFRGTLTVELKRANSGAAEPKKKSKPSGFKNPLRAKSKKSQDTSEESLLNPGLDNSYQTYSFHLKILKEEQ